MDGSRDANNPVTMANNNNTPTNDDYQSMNQFITHKAAQQNTANRERI